MAESLLFGLTESLIGKLASVAIKEASLALGVYKDLEEMKGVIGLITEVAAIRYFFSTSNPLVYRLRMAHQIKDLRERLDKVAADQLNFGLAIKKNDTRVMYLKEPTYSCVNPSNVIGREQDKKKIIELLKKDGHNKSLSVVPIERDLWGELRDILDVGVEGSKVLVTTRIDTIASMMQPEPSHCYSLPGLSPKDSFSIFVKCAFEEGKEKKHPQLLEIGEEIVRKCKGIPLAVKTLGSSLFSKFDEGEWKSVRDSAIWNLQQKERDIMPILQFSYDRLPSYLKPCFGCLSLFPEDFYIQSFYVSVMWDALCFLQSPRESETVNGVGNRYLRELLSRSFLTDFIDLDLYCFFKLHDLVRDHATYIAKGLRTIIFPKEATNEAFLNRLVSTCKYLTILDLSRSKYENLPRSIGNLKFLRYLCLLYSANLKSLPDSLCKLQSLQTLNLYGCIELQKLPKGIRALISLRHLLITTRQADVDFPEKEIANMTLETLQFCRCDNLEELFKGVQHFNLKSLLFSKCESLRKFSFHVLRSLESLAITECSMLDLSLGLGNQIPLSCLKLLHLCSLPQLVTLPMWLQRSSNTLNTLVIIDCFNLEHLPEWLSTMTSLRQLRIVFCPKLLTLPDCFNLERLTIRDCPVLWSRYHPQFGQDRHKISHIKHVIMEEQNKEFSDDTAFS
ncbi:hypothetical protein VNO78_21340 [Psophocarpus tetragonolobus]|uniref:NB-ARC domain-containing protein n=1 Tax=Psophocarpus tetragonolobus TaxID=3891 RepID=A0AAN9XHZ1_PSOTE